MTREIETPPGGFVARRSEGKQHTVAEALAVIQARAEQERRDQLINLQATAPELSRITCPAKDAPVEPRDPGTPEMYRRSIVTGELILDRRDVVLGEKGKPIGQRGETREKVRSLLDQGIADVTKIAKQLGISYATAQYHVERIRDGVPSFTEIQCERAKDEKAEPAKPASIHEVLVDCGECIHEPVCRLKDDRGYFAAQAEDLASKAPEGLEFEFRVTCRHAARKEAA